MLLNSSRRGQPALISVVVPVYFEERVLRDSYARLKAAMLSLSPDFAYELIFVNDGSTDGSGAILAELAGSDAAVRVVSLSRNFGHQLAITAGIDHAMGDAVVLIDADLQDPPEVIPQMVAKWQEGFKVVYGVRRSRAGETRFKLLTAKLFYRLLSRLSDVKIPLDCGDFRLMDRAVVDELVQIREESRYIRGLVSWVGFPQCPVEYERQPRLSGETKFRLGKMLRFALDGISSFSEAPLRLSGQVGLIVTVGSLLLMAWIIGGKIMNPAQTVAGWTSVMVAVLFLGGVQLISIGVLGEYIGRIFRQTKGRPLYVVAERINFDREALGRPQVRVRPAAVTKVAV